MKIRQYQDIMCLQSGSTTYESDVCNILGIDLNKKVKDIRTELMKLLNVPQIGFKDKLKINGKWYYAEKDFLDCTYEQFIELDRILAEEDNIKNLHRLLAIYFRPRKFKFKKLKYIIEPFNRNKQESISNEIRNYMEMKDGNSVILFFYLSATRSLKYMNIFYLNQMKSKKIMSIKNK